MPGSPGRSGGGPARTAARGHRTATRATPAAGRSPYRGRRVRRRGCPALLGALLACALLVGVGAGCAPVARVPAAPASADADPATRTLTVASGDGDRAATVHHPPAAGPGAPLVVVLHGAGGSGAGVRAHLGWDGLAERDGLVVAYPDGFDRTWNAGACCGSARDRGVDDVAFLDAVVAELRRRDGVGAVYAVGFSNGAMMAYRWACARPGTLAGIGAVAGALLVACPRPAPLTVVAVHGTIDERVPIGGGRGPSGVVFPSLDASLAPFRAGCTPAPVVEAAPARVDVRTCPDGRSVTSDVVDGLPHTWPGAGPDAGTADGPLDATGFLWARLRA